MKKLLKMVAVLLVLTMALSCFAGCQPKEPDKEANQTTTKTTTTKSDPQDDPSDPVDPDPVDPVEEEDPDRPDPTADSDFVLEYQLDQAYIDETYALIDTAEELSFSETATREEVEEAWDAVDDHIEFISTQIGIAQVIYYQDLKNDENSQQYEDGYDLYLDMADRVNTMQKDMYMDSPVKDWFFEDWSEEDIQFLLTYTTEQVEIQAELNEIEMAFLDLSDDELYEGFTDLYVRYVTLGNQQAKLAGYNNFYEYKSATTYSRDYTMEDVEKFQNNVKEVLMPQFMSYSAPLYEAGSKISDSEFKIVQELFSEDFDEMRKNYLQMYIDSYEGSTHDWLNHVFDKGYYITTDSRKSYEGAFCMSMEYYDTAFCYFGRGYQSTFTVVHELGHYYANYFNDGYGCFDLLETHSQGNEALLLAFLKDELPRNAYDYTKYYQLYNYLVTMTICCMVDEFEQRIYSMESVEGMTAADIDAIIDEVCEEYFGTYGGSQFVSRNLTDMGTYIRMVTINSPCYYISYATSAVSSMSLFAMADEDPAAAREVYRKLVEETGDIEGYVAALEHAGAANPFEKETLEQILELFS